MSRLVVITGNELRHRYIAAVLDSQLELGGIVAEGKVSISRFIPETNEVDAEVVRRHFAGRSAAEARLLGDVRSFPERADLLCVEHGQSNSAEVLDWVKARRPDAIVLFGSSIIRPPLLSDYEGRIINMHLGLSPYYRGSATNFWPLVDGVPECVGATIHAATLKVDGGDILSQTRPESVAATDRAHELGTNTIVAGAKRLCTILPDFLSGRVPLVQQNHAAGKLCRRKDFTPDAVRLMNANFDGGMMAAYLSEKLARDARYPIVE